MDNTHKLEVIDKKVDLILSMIKPPVVIEAKSDKDPFEVLSAKDVCSQYKVNEHVLYNLTSKGKIKTHKSEGGRILRFYRHECEAFFMNQ